jgi:hypothetical protein
MIGNRRYDWSVREGGWLPAKLSSRRMRTSEMARIQEAEAAKAKATNATPDNKQQASTREGKAAAAAPADNTMEEENLKPGQKHATPTPGNGDRVFYETLYRQRPDSEMAQEW